MKSRDDTFRRVCTGGVFAGWVLSVLGVALFVVSFFREFPPDMLAGGVLWIVGILCLIGGYLGRIGVALLVVGRELVTEWKLLRGRHISK